MRTLSWLGPLAALVVGYLAGAATSTGVAEAPSTTFRASDSPARETLSATRRARPGSPEVELTRALRRLSDTRAAAVGGAVGAPICGTVVDQQKSPVAGVLVRARPEFDAPADDEEDESTAIADVAARRLAWLRQVRGGTSTTTTRSDGTFRIDGVRGGLAYDVDVRTDGFARDSNASSSTEARAGDAVSLVVERRSALVVRVDGASEAPIVVETAIATSDGKPDFSAQSWSPSRPTLWVRPGMFLVRAVAGDSVTDVVKTEVECGCESQARLSLVAGGRIDCDVAWPRGLDRAGVEVTATRNGGSSETAAVSGELQADGRVTIRRLLPGRWTVSVTYPSRRIVETREADVATGDRIRLRFELPEPDARDFVVVRVLDEVGVAVTGAEVASHRSYGCCSTWDGPPAVETAPGVYRAFHAGLPEPEHRFCVGATVGGEHETADYEPGTDAEIVVCAPCMAPLDVRIGAGYSVRDAECANGSPFTAGDDGVAHMGMRHAGDVLLVRSDDPNSAMLVRHPSPGVVQWSPRPMRAWLVRGVTNGAAFDAGLRDDDLIVGVDGEEFRDAAHREAVWAAALARGRCRLDLLRGGKSVWIAMDASRFRHDRADAELASWVR